ncbi:unnamed protein product, partial [Nesidiocoris tenuis]
YEPLQARAHVDGHGVYASTSGRVMEWINHRVDASPSSRHPRSLSQGRKSRNIQVIEKKN